MWTEDGTLHKRDEDLAKTTVYGSDPREERGIPAPATISAIKIANSDKMVRDRSAGSKVEKKETVIDRDDSSDGTSAEIHPVTS